MHIDDSRLLYKLALIHLDYIHLLGQLAFPHSQSLWNNFPEAKPFISFTYSEIIE